MPGLSLGEEGWDGKEAGRAWAELQGRQGSGGRGYCAQVNKSSATPQEENQCRRRGRARQNVLSMIESIQQRPKQGIAFTQALPFSLSSLQSRKGCTGKRCSSRNSTHVTFNAGFPEMSLLSEKNLGPFFTGDAHRCGWPPSITSSCMFMDKTCT